MPSMCGTCEVLIAVSVLDWQKTETHEQSVPHSSSSLSMYVFSLAERKYNREFLYPNNYSRFFSSFFF